MFPLSPSAHSCLNYVVTLGGKYQITLLLVNKVSGVKSLVSVLNMWKNILCQENYSGLVWFIIGQWREIFTISARH